MFSCIMESGILELNGSEFGEKASKLWEKVERESAVSEREARWEVGFWS